MLGKTTVTIFAGETAVVASNINSLKALKYVQTHSNKVQHWQIKRKIKANESKSFKVVFKRRKYNFTRIFRKTFNWKTIRRCKVPWKKDKPEKRTYLLENSLA